MTYYSQFGEDRRLHKIFGSFRGTCVDVGAHDGSYCSNSRFFEESGWKCILVEPNPNLWPLIERSRPKSILFKGAASSAEGKLTLHVLKEADYLSTVCVDDHPYFGEYSAETPRCEYEIDAKSLDDILCSNGVDSIDFISIDVEGHEQEVLKGFSIPRWNPRIVLIEDTSEFQDERIPRFMAQHGYVRCYRTRSNDWYAKVEDARLVNFATHVQILYWKTRLKIRRHAYPLVKIKRTFFH